MTTTKRITQIAILLISLTFLNCSDQNNKTELEKIESTDTLKIYAYIHFVNNEQEVARAALDEIDFYSGNTSEMEMNEIIDKENMIIGNGFYIKNPEIDTTLYSVSNNVEIKMQTLSYDEFGNFMKDEEISLKRFVEIFNDSQLQHYKNIPFEVTIINNRIKSITEKYIQ